MDKARILVDARALVDSESGGVHVVARETLISLMQKMPEAQFIFATTGSKKPDLPEPFRSDPSVTHAHLSIPNKIWSLMAMFGIASLDREIAKHIGHPCDIAILPNIGFTGFLEIPYALILHDLSFRIEPSWFPFKMRLWHMAVNPQELARRADIVFSVSETTAHDAVRLFGIPAERVRTIRPGSPAILSSEHLPVESEGRYVLALGGDNPRKNASTAMVAVESLRKDPHFADLRLIIVGWHSPLPLQPDPPTGRQATRQPDNPTTLPHPPYHWLTILPRTSDGELASLYEHAAAFLYPSWYEGYGLPLHEAARHRTPCLASTHGALPETAPAGTVFIPPSKPHLWTVALRHALECPEQHRTVFDPANERPDIEPLIRWIRQAQFE